MPMTTILILSVADALIRLLLLAMVGMVGFLWLLHGAAARSAINSGRPVEGTVTAPPSGVRGHGKARSKDVTEGKRKEVSELVDLVSNL